MSFAALLMGLEFKVFARRVGLVAIAGAVSFLFTFLRCLRELANAASSDYGFFLAC